MSVSSVVCDRQSDMGLDGMDDTKAKTEIKRNQTKKKTSIDRAHTDIKQRQCLRLVPLNPD